MIRKIDNTNIPALIVIWDKAASIAHHFLSDEFHQMVKKAMEEMYLPNSETWVYWENEQALGFVSMMGNEIGGLFVGPSHQGKGIGGKLVAHVAEMHPTIEVEVFEQNKIGRPFYEKIGFQPMKTFIHEPTQEKVIRLQYVQ